MNHQTNNYLFKIRNFIIHKSDDRVIRTCSITKPNYDRAAANMLMIVEIIFILIMLAFLIYWHINHPDSKAVTLQYERELLEQDNRAEDDD